MESGVKRKTTTRASGPQAAPPEWKENVVMGRPGHSDYVNVTIIPEKIYTISCNDLTYRQESASWIREQGLYGTWIGNANGDGGVYYLVPPPNEEHNLSRVNQQRT